MGGQSGVEACAQALEQMRMVFLDVELCDRPSVDGFNSLSERTEQATHRIGTLPLLIASRLFSTQAQ